MSTIRDTARASLEVHGYRLPEDLLHCLVHDLQEREVAATENAVHALVYYGGWQETDARRVLADTGLAVRAPLLEGADVTLLGR